MSRVMWRLKTWAKPIFAASILACPLASLTDQAHAIAVGVDSSSYEITHISGFGPTDSLGPKQIPTWPPTTEYNQTLNSGPNTSHGRGGGGTFVSPFLVGLGFPKLTGVSQDWIAGQHSEASLRIDFNVVYDVIGGFGPPTTAFANFLLKGVVSDNGWVRFSYAAEFTAEPRGGILGGRLEGSYYNETPGIFTNVPVTEVHTNNNGVIGDGQIDLTGWILFEAFDGTNHSTSGIELATRGDILPPIPLPGTAVLLLPALGALLGLRRIARRTA
ncbi:MAG: hypothetical protein AAGF94_12200 [Pseudomonadota bacterium]